MSFRIAFMISLMLLTGCKEDNKPVFESGEAESYDRITADFSPPEHKWGFLTEDGKLAIEDKYDDLREFNDGLAAMCINGLWGYLDKTGKEVIPARYKTVKTYSEGIAVVQDLNDKFHLLNEAGVPISDTLDFQGVGKFSEGLSPVDKSFLFGYINKEGRVVIEPIYNSAKAFRNGLAIVQKGGKYGMINTKNEEVLPFEYEKIWHPQSGMIRFKKDGKYGFIDDQSKAISFSGFATATDFQQDYAVANLGDNYILLDKAGNKKSLPFGHVDMGGEGKWIYQADDHFGFLHNDGTVLTLPQFDLLMRYQEGRAGYAIDDNWGYLDEEGSAIIPAQYPLVWDFVNGHARIIGRYGFGFIDRSGNIVDAPKYMEVRDYSEGLARIQVYRR